MKNKRILLVDDETDFVTTLSERLKLRGLQADIATDGFAAVQMVETAPPDIMILDLKMPGMDGLEVLKKTRALSPKTRVILLTGHGSTKEGIEGMKLGAYDYLMKPINIEDLVEKMKEQADSR